MIIILLSILITWNPQPCDSFGVYAASGILIGTTADTCYQFDAGASVRRRIVGTADRDSCAAIPDPGLVFAIPPKLATHSPQSPRHYYYVTAFLDTRESAPSEYVSALLLDWDQEAANTCRVKRWCTAKRQHMLRIDLPGQAESWCVYWEHDTDSVTAICEFEVTGDGWIGLSDLAVLRPELQHLSTFCRFSDVYQKQGVIEYGTDRIAGQSR